MGEHALLAPSSGERWLNCTRAPRIEEKLADTAGQDAAEGTLAHRLGELMIKRKLGMILKKKYDQAVEGVKAHYLYSKAMWDHCENYSSFVVERFMWVKAQCPEAVILIEETVHIDDYAPGSFGTGDVIILSDLWNLFIDLKYGQGVEVSAVDNAQMKLYGLGVIQDYGHVFNLENVQMTIYQPRLDNISTFEMSRAALEQWGEQTVKPKAKLAWEGKGLLVAGKHCKFCRAKATCKELARFNQELAKYDFKDPDKLDAYEIAEILEKYDPFIDWLKAVEDYALNEAMKGKKFPGWKVIYGRSHRKYKDEKKVIDKLIKNGMTLDEITKRTLLGLGDMEKLLGGEDFNRLLSNLLIKPDGAPTLAREDAKGVEYSSINRAKKDFAK